MGNKENVWRLIRHELRASLVKGSIVGMTQLGRSLKRPKQRHCQLLIDETVLARNSSFGRGNVRVRRRDLAKALRPAR